MKKRKLYVAAALAGLALGLAACGKTADTPKTSEGSGGGVKVNRLKQRRQHPGTNPERWWK